MRRARHASPLQWLPAGEALADSVPVGHRSLAQPPTKLHHLALAVGEKVHQPATRTLAGIGAADPSAVSTRTGTVLRFGRYSRYLRGVPVSRVRHGGAEPDRLAPEVGYDEVEVTRPVNVTASKLEIGAERSS